MTVRLLNIDLSLRRVIFLIGEGLLIYAAVLLPVLFGLGAAGEPLPVKDLLVNALILLAVLQLSFYLNDLYEYRASTVKAELALALTRATGVAFVILAPVYFLCPSACLGNNWALVIPLLILVLVLPWRYLYGRLISQGMLTERILILGYSKLARDILDELQRRTDTGFKVAGVVRMSQDTALPFPERIPLLNYNGSMQDVLGQQHVKKIIIAMDDRRGKLPIEELLRWKTNGIEVVDGITFYERLTGRLLIDRMNPSFIVYSDGFCKSRLTRSVKRLSDMILAVLGLLVACPLAAILALAIRLDSRGPIIFRQKRCGQGGRVFELLKFRTMVPDAEVNCKPAWASVDDCRVTRVGRILRNYRLDEIPQLWNVVRGDMSFVGPRPERPEFVEGLKQIIPYYMERHAVKPGITGWAQVSYGYGASVPDAVEKLRYDLFYVKNMSLLIDLIIFIRTIKVVLGQNGAR